ncbi:IclR family transcriptional regulator [Ruegeria sp. SCP11]|uniref:IclR family transcriptional regulator n=1 Tax=Ruegeria sp. SCP11 TaxID=3141378 RepID=UPI00333E0098
MVLPRAFALLRLLANSSDGMTLSNIAADLEVPKSSLSSTLNALADQNFLTRRGTLYTLGSEAYALASVILAGRSIRQISRPYLEQGMKMTGETVLLAQLDQDKQYISYVDTVEPDKSVRLSVPIATRRALYCSAAGQVFLAHMSDQERDKYFDATQMEELTDTTLVKREDLERALDIIRSQGFAMTVGTYYADAAGFACPVYNADDELVASVVVGVPVTRAQKETQRFIDAVVQVGANISKTLGYKGSASG